MNPHNPSPEHHYNILELYRQGWPQTQIAKALGFSRRTVYNHIHNRVFQPGKLRGRPRGSRKLSPYFARIRSRLELQPDLNISCLWRELQGQGYLGGLSILRDYCRLLKQPEPAQHGLVSAFEQAFHSEEAQDMSTSPTISVSV